ncbi:MAG: DUF2059 domain-containing protein [Sphingomonadales bacterium]|nr:DUF2059 domain-containing protein [Sphingomonadales bacterium]
MNRFHTFAAGATLALSFALPLHAPAAAMQADAAASPLHTKSLALARITASEAIVIGNNSDKMIAELTRLLMLDEDIVELETDSPGSVDEMVRAMLPIMDAGMRQRLPDLQASYAAVYARDLTVEEIDFLIAFYSGPTGQKLINGMLDNMQLDAVGQQLLASGFAEGSITPDAVMNDMRAAIPAAMEEMTAADYEVLKTLGAHPVLPKLIKLGTEAQQIHLDWSDIYAPGEEEAINAVIEDIVVRRLGELDD